MGSSWGSKHGYIRRILRTGGGGNYIDAVIESPSHRADPFLIDVEELDGADLRWTQLSGQMRTGSSKTGQGDSHECSSDSGSSRQPPVCGGTPPWPRRRNRVAINPARPSAAETRRNSVNINAAYWLKPVRPKTAEPKHKLRFISGTKARVISPIRVLATSRIQHQVVELRS